ncbi:MAG: hypothetical protein J6Q89_00045 [Clostridia bacterium]|nr:hypothetical protein [Clostridia bacterium]
MQKYAKQNKILGRIFLTLGIISVLCIFGGFFLYAKFSDDIILAMIFLGFFMSATFLGIYFVKYFWYGHTFKLLKKSGLEHYLDDIDLTAPPTFEPSKIYCGENAFFCKKTGSVVAYDQFAWIYSIGGHLGEHTIRLKNGKKAYIMIHDQELNALLNFFVLPKNPKLIVGKTFESRKEFLSLYPESAPVLAQGKLIGGSILLAFAFFAFICRLIQNTLDGSILVTLIILGVIGLGILLLGIKESNINK